MCEVIVGAVIGGLAALAGSLSVSFLVEQWKLRQEARLDLYWQLLPELDAKRLERIVRWDHDNPFLGVYRKAIVLRGAEREASKDMRDRVHAAWTYREDLGHRPFGERGVREWATAEIETSYQGLLGAAEEALTRLRHLVAEKLG